MVALPPASATSRSACANGFRPLLRSTSVITQLQALGARINMFKPASDLLRRPEHAQFGSDVASQRTVGSQLAALGPPRLNPSREVGLACSVTAQELPLVLRTILHVSPLPL